MKTLSIDIETYSDVVLPKSGVYRYCESPNFEVLLFAYSADYDPVQVVDLACGEQIPANVLEALTDEAVIKWAFNAAFERICLSRYLRDLGISLDPFHGNHPLSQERARFLSPESWRCSMIWAATMGLPLSLEGAGAVLGLEKQKLTEGKDLIKYFCQPCAPTKANGQRTQNRPFHAPDKWEAFKRYNLRDVETEMGIQQKLAKFPVPQQIWEEYHIDQEINDRGVRIDMELVRQAIQMDTHSRQELIATSWWAATSRRTGLVTGLRLECDAHEYLPFPGQACFQHGGGFFYTTKRLEETKMRDFSIDLIWTKVQIAITALGGWLGYFLGGMDGLMIALIVLMTLDYISGVMCAIIDKKLSSAVGFKGVCKKVFILMLVGVAHIIDLHVVGTGSALRGAVICFYMSNEGLSLLENAAHIGLPIPDKLRDILAQLHDKERTTDQGDGE